MRLLTLVKKSSNHLVILRHIGWKVLRLEIIFGSFTLMFKRTMRKTRFLFSVFHFFLIKLLVHYCSRLFGQNKKLRLVNQSLWTILPNRNWRWLLREIINSFQKLSLDSQYYQVTVNWKVWSKHVSYDEIYCSVNSSCFFGISSCLK